jgi:hypothetical protein
LVRLLIQLNLKEKCNRVNSWQRLPHDFMYTQCWRSGCTEQGTGIGLES